MFDKEKKEEMLAERFLEVETNVVWEKVNFLKKEIEVLSIL